MALEENAGVQTVSVVVPVYQGELTLEALLLEIEPMTSVQSTPRGIQFYVSEVMLVHDGAIDASDVVMKSLAAKMAFIIPIWLSRNFGQHSATPRRPGQYERRLGRLDG